MNIFKINDVIIKLDNYEHQKQHFSVGVVLLEVVADYQCHKPSPPPPPQYAEWGWCAALTLRQYLVCRECRKVAQHWSTPLVISIRSAYRVILRSFFYKIQSGYVYIMFKTE
jgi:hypothetical protein